MSLQLKTCFLIKAALDVVISFNFFSRMLSNTKKLRLLIIVIASTFIPAEYIYIVIKRVT